LFRPQDLTAENRWPGNHLIEFGTILEWSRSHNTALWALSVLSLVTFVGTLIMIPFFISRIPEDYFIRRRTNRRYHYIKRSFPRFAYLLFKNIAGAIFVLTGLLMLFLPGQGIITILIGITLMNFPGKRKLAFRIIRQPKVLDTINWIRGRSEKPPLRLPENCLTAKKSNKRDHTATEK
jgi:hypothetical protein